MYVPKVIELKEAAELFICGQCQEELQRAKYIIVMDLDDQRLAWMEEDATKCSACDTEQDFPVIFNNEEEANSLLLEIENHSAIGKGEFKPLPTNLFAHFPAT